VSPSSSEPADAHRAQAFARLFEAVHEGVFIGSVPLDADSGSATTLAVNPHLKLMFGLSVEADDEGVAPFAPDRFADPLARAPFLERLVRDGAVTGYLLRLRRIDGATVWVEVTARAEPPVRGAAHVEALIRDVSERKKLDDQSRDVYQQLLQAEKMAALGQTISGVAHELNNPLATILNWAERLSERPLDDVSRRGVGVILSEAGRAARIVRNLLTFARKRQSTRAMIDVNDVVRDTLSLRAYEQRVANIEAVTALAAGLPRIFADSHQIQQVLLNLIINAEQAMVAANGRGSFVVRTWHDAEREAVALEVSDDGPGIAPEVTSKIFDPFFTTKEVGKGTGLGLTVAYAIVQDHGGRIRVEPGAARGAAFIVELPVSGLQGATPPTRTQLPSMEAVRGRRVLLVEDEHALAVAVAEALVDAGLDVDHASDGEDALARGRQRTYDAVICDVKMPRVDGMVLYRAMAAATPALARRVIFVTGDVAGIDEGFIADSGCRWLAKPFRLADLLRTVRDTLA
jgi:signal transduction histidine kinase/BarA-like signal transduction histidine kinase